MGKPARRKYHVTLCLIFARHAKERKVRYFPLNDLKQGSESDTQRKCSCQRKVLYKPIEVDNEEVKTLYISFVSSQDLINRLYVEL